MSSAIGLSSPTRNQASIPLEQSAYSGVQDFSKFDAAELSGYVEAVGSSSFRASVKLSIVKNGAGTYEVAASDIAGDDVSGAPLVSFQMTGSLLEAKIDDGVASFSSAVIKFALISPPNSAGSLSIDASSVVSGTIDSARLPLATGSSAGAIPFYEEGTWTPSTFSSTNLRATTGNSITYGDARYTRIGNMVFASILSVNNVEIIADDTQTQLIINSTGLPGVTNDTKYSGSASVRVGDVPREPLSVFISDSNTTTDTIYLQINSDSAFVINGDDLTIFNILLQYFID